MVFVETDTDGETVNFSTVFSGIQNQVVRLLHAVHCFRGNTDRSALGDGPSILLSQIFSVEFDGICVHSCKDSNYTRT